MIVGSEVSKMSRNKGITNEINADMKKSMKTRILTAIFGTILVLPIMFVGDWLFFGLAVFFASIGAYEIIHSNKKDFSIWLYIVSILLVLAFMLWPFLKSIRNDVDLSHVYNTFSALYLSNIIMFVGIVALFLVVILNTAITVTDACYYFVFLLIVALGIQASLYVRYVPSLYNHEPRSYINWFDNFESSSLLFYVIFGTFFTDTGAYFVGVFFGKHKINERISPKKTYEGFFGGIIISMLVSMAFAFTLALCKHPILKGVFDLEHWYHIVGLSALMPIMATLGDFVFSAAKRNYGIKDFGFLLPGHGGVCDRLDSWFFVFITAAIYICIVEGTIFI